MKTIFKISEKLKDYSSFLLNNHLEDLTKENISRARENKLPILKIFHNYTEEELFNFSKKKLTEFLESIIQGNVFEVTNQNIENWKSDKHPDVHKEEIELNDIILINNSRKLLLMSYLKKYTQELSVYEEILFGIESYFTFITTKSFSGFIEIQKEKIENEQKFIENLISNSNDGIFALNTNLEYTIWNKEAEKITGIKKEKVLGKNIYEVSPHYKFTEVGKTFEQALRGENFHIRAKWYDKLNKFIDSYVTPLYDDDSNIIGVLSISHDVTESVKKDQHIREHEHLINQIFESTPDLIFVYDLEEKRYIYFNNKIADLLGYSFEEISTSKEGFIGQIVVKEDAPYLLNKTELLKGASDNEIVESEYRVQTRKQEEKWLNTRMTVFKRDTSGKVIQILGITRDITKAKITEQQNEENNKLIEYQRAQLLDAQAIANVGSYDWDIIQDKTIVTPQIKKIFGHEDGKIVNNKVFEKLIYPEDRVKVAEAIKNSIKEKTDYECEYRIIRENDQSLRYISAKGKISYDTNGNPIRMLGTVLDITELKLIEDKLHQLNTELEARVQERTKELREAQRISKIGNWKVDWINRKIYWSEEMFRIYELDPEGGEPDFEKGMLYFEDREKLLSVMMKAINECVSYNFDTPIITAKGNKKIIQIIGKPVFDNSGNCILLFGTTMDITKRKVAEEALKRSEENYKLLSETIPQLIWKSSAQGNAEYFNSNWYLYTGQTQQEASGTGWSQAIHPDDIQKTFKQIEKAFQNEEAFQTEYRIRKFDGTYRWFLAKGVPYRENASSPIKWFGTSTDIHDRKIIEEALKVKNEELSRINNDLDSFIYTASHDLKAPVSNIEGLLITLFDVVNEETKKDPDVIIIRSMLEKSISKFRETIQDLTEISKAQRAINDHIEKITISEIIEEVLDTNEKLIGESNATFNLDLDGCTTILFSKPNFRSILFNLINNALKYRDPERPLVVDVKCQTSGNEVMLEIKDNGLGIKRENQNKIFTMFKRFHDHVEGTGVGLYIVKKLVENAGGKIEVESEAGKGTCFKIILKNPYS